MKPLANQRELFDGSDLRSGTATIPPARKPTAGSSLATGDRKQGAAPCISKPLSRSSDPATSHAAERQLCEGLGLTIHRTEAYLALLKSPGKTCAELGEIHGKEYRVVEWRNAKGQTKLKRFKMDQYFFARRLHDLRDMVPRSLAHVRRHRQCEIKQNKQQEWWPGEGLEDSV